MKKENIVLILVVVDNGLVHTNLPFDIDELRLS